MAGSKKSEKQLESKERQLAPSCAATHHGHWTVQIFFGQIFLHFATFLLQIEHLCQMESVKDERMKALWRPFCAGEVRRDKPGGHHHQCCQRCSCFLSCRASALSPASPSPRARQGTGGTGLGGRRRQKFYFLHARPVVRGMGRGVRIDRWGRGSTM